MEPTGTKRPAEPGRLLIAIGVPALILGIIFGALNLSAIGSGFVSNFAVILTAVGALLTVVGFLKKP